MSTLPSGLFELIGDAETLARFLTSSSHFNSHGVKPGAFLPNPHNGETSVFRHDEQPEERLLKIGQTIVEMSGRSIHGTAFVKAEDVRSITLEIEAFEPPERHANINNWPKDPADRVLQKARQKELALLLADKAILRKY